MSGREESCSYHWLDEVTGQGHQARQQVQRYKQALLVMLRPPPDPVPCHPYVLVGLFNVCRLWPA